MSETPPHAPDVVVCVSTYRRPQLLPRLVAALEKQTYPADRFEIVVVDNGSGDTTPSVLRSLADASPLRLRSLVLEQNRGPAGARNRAWRTSRAPLVAFTDDDCEPEPEWLESGVALLGWDKSIGVVQGRTLVPVDAGSYPWTDWTVFRDIRWPSPWFEGCNLFFRREALEAVGGFDEDIGWYGEETSLGWALLAAGWERAFADDAVVRHDLSERGWRYHMRQRYLEGNMVRIAARYPALRQEGFWRPWAMHRRDALFALAVLGAVGVVAGPWRKVALALAVPYLWEQRPPARRHRKAALLAERVAVDAGAFAGTVAESVRARIFVL